MANQVEEIDFEELLQKNSPPKINNEDLNDDEPKIIVENKTLSNSRIEPIRPKPTTPIKSLRSDSQRRRSILDDDDEPKSEEKKDSETRSEPKSETKESEPREDPREEPKREERKEPEKKRTKENLILSPQKEKPPARLSPYRSEDENMTEQELMDEYKYKFKMLKKNYPEIEMPEKSSNLKELKKAYERAWKEVNDDVNVKSYYIYLIIGFFAVEYFTKHVVGIELTGFTINRVNNIRRYNHLLIELGERPYTSLGSSWPVEVRLCLFVVVDAVIFYIISRIAGGNSQIMDTISNLISGFTKSGGEGGGGGGLGDIVGLLGQVMGGMGGGLGNLGKPESKPEPKPEANNQPYVMRQPPKFVKKTT